MFKAGSVDAAVVWSPDDDDCVSKIAGAKKLKSTREATHIIADVENVYVQTAYTLGAKKHQIISSVFVPAVLSRVLDDTRIFVAIARSLVADPEILLMDEPFGALDLDTRPQMQDLLREIWTKLQSTIVFVTHDLPEAVYLADEIHIMRACPGMIVEKIDVNLPLQRERSLKHSSVFMNIVHDVENRMIEIQNFMDEEKKQQE